MARADFLENPDLVLVQAFAIFLILARRHDSPRFVWMMVGLLVRMAQSIGLQRDGTHFTHLTPFEVEMRRRAWYNVLALDQRSSDDMGTTFSISRGSYDTRLPTNLRDSDLNPDTKELPRGREEVCEVTASISSWAINEVIRDVMAASDIQEQDRLLNEIWKVFEHRYLRYMTDTTSWFYWYIHHCNRLVIAKNTLFVYLPALLNDLNTEIKEQSRDKMLVCAIEVAEYNHYLNAEERVRGLRWLTQSFTQWHAIVYLLLEIVRRPWSPIVERAWVALHSSWLIPSRSTMTKNERIWATLRKLMARARKHRRQELHALCADPMSVDKRELDEAGRFVLGSSGPFPRERAEELFTAHWRSLFEPSGPTTLQHGGEGRTLESSMYCPYNSSKGTPSSTSDASRARAQSGAAQVMDHAESQPRLHVDEIARASGDAQSAGLSAPSFAGVDLHSMATNFSASSTLAGPGAQVAPPYMAQPAISADWSGGQPIGPGFSAWLWADSDPESDTYGFSTDSLGMDMDLDETAMDWNGWLDEARGMYW